MNLTIAEIVQAVDGKLLTKTSDTNQTIEKVEFDARKITANDLFIPMKGRRDGQEFIDQAITNGARVVLLEDLKYQTADVVCIQVKDTLQALQQLASYYLAKVHPKVVAITGSNGKTTTKDMTYAVLSQKYQTYKTVGNYNNNIGMPYTILHMPATTEVLVLELGMDDFGQIEELTKIAKPDLAAITMIGESHMEQLGSRAGIAQAKLEITAGMTENSTLFLPADEPLLFEQTLIPQVKTFSVIQDADLTATVSQVNQNKTLFTTNLDQQTWEIPVLGDYNVSNALIALHFGQALGVSIEAMHQGLANFSLTAKRTEWLARANGAEILSDIYNANPTAMRKVLINFSQLQTEKQKQVVLGDMLELGVDSQAMHEQMAEVIDSEIISDVYLYGTEMKSLADKLAAKYEAKHLHYYTLDERHQLMADLDKALDADTMTMFKASNGMNLAEIVEKLVNEEN